MVTLNQGWVMSHVVRDVKFLESPFPHGFCRGRMPKLCCLPRQQNSFKFYQVILCFGFLFSNQKVIASIESSYSKS